MVTVKLHKDFPVRRDRKYTIKGTMGERGVESCKFEIGLCRIHTIPLEEQVSRLIESYIKEDKIYITDIEPAGIKTC